MDCENNTSLSQTIMKIEEPPKEMKPFNFKTTGEKGDINHMGEEAVIFNDSGVGEPDEGNSNEGDGVDNIADEIGEPAKELVDDVAGEPTVGTDSEKDDEFGAFVGEPVEEDSSNSIQALGKDNSIESLKVTDNVDHSVNGEEILEANDKPVEEDSSNSMQEFEKKTSTECLKVTDNENCSVNEDKILKIYVEPVEGDNNQSMQEVEEDISNECLKAIDNEDRSVNEEEFPKACGEPVKEDSSKSMQAVKEENSTEPLKVIDNEECSVNDEVPKANEGNIQCALADTDTISKINIKSEVPRTCISDTKALSNVKSSGALKKEGKNISGSRRKTSFKSSSNEEKSKVEDVKFPEGHMLNVHGNDDDDGSDGGGIKGYPFSGIYKITKEKSKYENTRTPEEYMPNIHGDDNDVGTDGVEAQCLKTMSVKMNSNYQFIFGFHWKIELLLLVKIMALVNSAAGATIPSQSYKCCTFDTVAHKISNFSIKLGTEDICIHDPYANLFICTHGLLCFILNNHIVKFCNNTNTVEALIMEHGQSRTTIHSSNPEELSAESLKILQDYYVHNSPITTTNPLTTTLYSLLIKKPETRVHFPMIAAAGVAAILILCLCVLCYCRSFRQWARDHWQCIFICSQPSTARPCDDQTDPDLRNEDMTAEEQNE